MENVKQLKIDFDIEFISNIQLFLMNLLNTHDIVYDIDGNIVNEINATAYCKSLRFTSERKELCHCYSWELSKSAIYYKKVFEDNCPGGLTIQTIPICLDENTVIGAHCVTISNPPRSKFSVYDIASQYKIDAHILWDAVKKSPLIPKPILKIAAEQGVLSTELMSKVMARVYMLQQSEDAVAKKFHSIEEIVKNKKE